MLPKPAVDSFPIVGLFRPAACVSWLEFSEIELNVSEFGVKSRIAFRLKKDPDFFQL